LREHYGHNTATDIQRDIDLMRKMYDRREPLNRRRSSFVPWFAIGIAIGGVIAIITLF
jgi:hypothetical protein